MIGPPSEVLRQARYLMEAAGLLAVITFFGLLPIDWASAVGGWIGRTVGPHLGVARRALRNLQRALPDNSDADNRRIVRGMWDNLGRWVAELRDD